MSRNNHIPYVLGEGNNNSFVIFDLLKNPQLYTEDFLQKAHKILLNTGRDDALILLADHVNQETQHVYIRMIVLEPDASLAAFCGNGARVVAAYLQKYYRDEYKQFSLVTNESEHKLLYFDHGLFGVELGVTTFNPAESEFVEGNNNLFLESPTDIWSLPYTHDGIVHTLYFTQTIEPHLVCFSEISDQTLCLWGTYFNTEKRSLFPKGININRAKVLSDSEIAVTTYERGVNRITQSCGTGSTSSAVLAVHLGKIHAPTIIAQNKGGQLEIRYDRITKKSITIGPATIQDTHQQPMEKKEVIF